MTAVVVNLTQLREALRVAEQTDRDLVDADPLDSVQIHLDGPEEPVLRVVLFSNGAGQAVGRLHDRHRAGARRDRRGRARTAAMSRLLDLRERCDVACSRRLLSVGGLPGAIVPAAVRR